jgi:capsular polysaccharide transport system permease protein
MAQMDKNSLQAGLKPRKYKTPRTIMALILREMTTSYGRSPGGYLWAFLEPIGIVAVMTLIFTLGLRLRSPSLGTSFVLFYATGMMAFQTYQRVQAKVAKSITFSRPLLFYPSVTYIDTILARFILNFLTQLAVFIIAMSAIILLIDTRAVLSLPPILTALTMAGTLSLGVGTLNAYLVPTFALWKSIWGIATAPLFFLSCIFYTFEELPALGKTILWYNPVVHIVGVMRRGFYPNYEAIWVSYIYVFGLSAVLLFFGVLLLRRYHRDILA